MRTAVQLSWSGLVGSVLLLAACSRPLAPQDSCGFVQNHERQRVSWKGALPVKLKVHESVPEEAFPAIDRAVEEYNARLGRGREILKIVERNAPGSTELGRDGTSMIYWLKVWDGKSNEQARTTIHWSGVEIFEADLRINAAGFRYHYGNETSFSDLDLDSLMVHELGHVLGLAHNASTGSVMNITLADGQDRRELGHMDLAGLQCEY